MPQLIGLVLVIVLVFGGLVLTGGFWHNVGTIEEYRSLNAVE